jgi:hypothetical protein
VVGALQVALERGRQLPVGHLLAVLGDPQPESVALADRADQAQVALQRPALVERIAVRGIVVVLDRQPGEGVVEDDAGRRRGVGGGDCYFGRRRGVTAVDVPSRHRRGGGLHLGGLPDMAVKPAGLGLVGIQPRVDDAALARHGGLDQRGIGDE